MSRTPPFLADPADTREEIMGAVYRALCTHGYANLTIQLIADEFAKSKSLLYHHYDGKDDLLLDFLEFMLERFEERIPFPEGEDVAAHLDTFVDRMLVTPMPEDYREFSQAMVELRAQAAHDDEYRDYFTRSDRLFRRQIARILRAGIDRGAVRDVDPDRTAATIHALIIGAMTQRVTTDDETTADVRAELDRYLRECVYRDAE